MIDTHCHLDGEEFASDLEQVVARAREAGVTCIGVPGIDLKSCDTIKALCQRFPDYCIPMYGLHPEGRCATIGETSLPQSGITWSFLPPRKYTP